MRFNNAVIGLLLVVFAIAEMLYSRNFPPLYGQNYGPNLFPLLIGFGLLVCGLILTFQGVSERREVPLIELGDWSRSAENWINLALIVGLLLFYIYLSDLLGFILCSLLILTTLLFRFGMSIGMSLILALVVTLFIHTLFATFLLVPLPWGILQAVAW